MKNKTDWKKQLTCLLDDLEARIDPEVEQEYENQWHEFLNGNFTGDLFLPKRRQTTPPSIPVPEIRINDAIANPYAMAIQQFAGCSQVLENGVGFMAVRCNYGTSILPSVLGAPVCIMPDEMNTLPTATAIPGGLDALRQLLAEGTPDLNRGQGKDVWRMTELFLEIKSCYPKIKRWVHLYHPDLQGPMDVCEMIWGSGLFLDLLDQAELIQQVLQHITDTYIRFLDRWFELVKIPLNRTVHWGMLMDGAAMLRDDSAMNLSPAMFHTFIRPYDTAILAHFNGGGIHFCGKGDHYIDQAAAIPGMNAIAMSQPEYNDMEIIFRHTIDQGIPLLGLSLNAAKAALAAGRDLQGRVHCWAWW